MLRAALQVRLQRLQLPRPAKLRRECPQRASKPGTSLALGRPAAQAQSVPSTQASWGSGWGQLCTAAARGDSDVERPARPWLRGTNLNTGIIWAMVWLCIPRPKARVSAMRCCRVRHALATAKPAQPKCVCRSQTLAGSC